MKRILVFLGGVAAGTAIIFLLALLCMSATAPERYNVLVVGSDQRGTERARSDVLFVVSLPKKADAQPVFFTIPRDTLIEHEEYGVQKITHFYAYGDRPDDGTLLGNIDLTRSVVEELLDIKIDASVEVTFNSFEEIIESIGGTTIDGQPANAQEAIASIRDRFTGSRSDFDRQADAREVLRSTLTQLKSPATAKRVLAYINASEYARLEWNKMKAVRFLAGAGIARKGHIELGEMTEESVPGEGGRIYTPDFGKELYYWVPDEEALETLVKELF